MNVVPAEASPGTSADATRRLHRAASAPTAQATVVIPARDEQATIGRVVTQLLELVSQGDVVEVVVVDSGSTDATARLAEDAGARVVTQRSEPFGLASQSGKGEAMWQAVFACDTEILCFLDADLVDIGPESVRQLIDPLRANDDLVLVKSDYQRSLKVGDRYVEGLGGRVNSLMARPLIEVFWPELSHIGQPLAGEYAARRDALAQIPFFPGYGVDLGLLVSLSARFGAQAITQAHLGTRRHRNRPLAELEVMSTEILRTALRLNQLEPGRDLARVDEVLEATIRPAPSSLMHP